VNMDMAPIWAIFVGTILVVFASIEAGYLLGRHAHRRSEDEKESPVSTIAGTVLGLLAFILAFTFGIVFNRYDARKELVKQEANAIGTAWLRSDFLPEPDRAEAKGLYKVYLENSLDFIQGRDASPERARSAISETQRILNRLWEMGVVNARKDMNSDVAALYIESMNEVIDLRALRIAVGRRARMPAFIWVMLFSLTCLGMMSVGYQTGIAGSKRSMVRPILAVAFALVIALIAALDRPDSGVIRVSHQSQLDLLSSMGTQDENRK
jgi:hypothetical protein